MLLHKFFNKEQGLRIRDNFLRDGEDLARATASQQHHLERMDLFFELNWDLIVCAGIDDEPNSISRLFDRFHRHLGNKNKMCWGVKKILKILKQWWQNFWLFWSTKNALKSIN